MGGTSQCVRVCMCVFVVFGQCVRGCDFTMLCSVCECAPLRGCHFAHSSFCRSINRIRWVYDQISTPFSLYTYLHNGRLCNQIIFKAECLIRELAQLPRQVLEARRVAVVKLFSKSVLKYVFFARGLALYVNSSVDILHVSLRACMCECVCMRYAVLRETLIRIQFKLFNLLNPNSNFLL